MLLFTESNFTFSFIVFQKSFSAAASSVKNLIINPFSSIGLREMVRKSFEDCKKETKNMREGKITDF